jgi:hypothetical protein
MASRAAKPIDRADRRQNAPTVFATLSDLVATLPRDWLEWLIGAAIDRLDTIDGDSDLEVGDEDYCITDLPHD